jgi:CheY-like chemotaxis protein
MNRPYILVVDDNRITTKLMRRYLENNDFEAGDAGDGVECLERVKERKPDAIILDVMMPRMDGFETVRMLKSDPNTRDIPVAIVTALNDMATQLRAVEAGADDFLTKPIEEKLLVTKARMLSSCGVQRQRNDLLRAAIDKLLTGDVDGAKAIIAEVDRSED